MFVLFSSFGAHHGEVALFPVNTINPTAKNVQLDRSLFVAGGVRKDGLGVVGKCSLVLTTRDSDA